MRDVAGIMLSAVEDNFEAQGRAKWKDLQQSTKDSRAKQGTWPGKILQRSGHLASSIVTRHSAYEAAVGTNVAYAAIHQFGGRTKAHVIRPKAKRALSFGGIVVRQVCHPGSEIPARPFLKMTKTDIRYMTEDVVRWYWRTLAQNGLAR
ncbi:phage virion morphogenesis protein [Comamonas sp. BIGb0124]|nr:phage virion morphogenesis protein [Comamonas sp. BIGb0124]